MPLMPMSVLGAIPCLRLAVLPAVLQIPQTHSLNNCRDPLSQHNLLRWYCTLAHKI